MTKDVLLQRLAEIEEARLEHEEKEKALLIARDALIYEALVADPPIAKSAEIARVIGVDRSWPYTIRDGYPERRRIWDARQ